MSDSTDKTCALTVHNVLGWELDGDMLAEFLRRLSLHVPQAHIIDIYPQERVPTDAPVWENPGWLEWHASVLYRGGGALYIACIQRTPGAAYEYHT
jgi:predicted small metal-binding protein